MKQRQYEDNQNEANLYYTLLNAREQKWNFICRILESSKIPSIELSLNTPGFPKVTKLTTQVLALGKKVVDSMLLKSIVDYTFISSFAGDSIIFFVDESPYYLKKYFYAFETKWRIFDFDVFYFNNSINTHDIGEHQKACFLCKNPYGICQHKAHSLEDVINYFSNTCHEFLRVFS